MKMAVSTQLSITQHLENGLLFPFEKCGLISQEL